MLDRAGDTQSNVQLRMYGLAGLTNLMVSRQPAGVDCSTGTANNAAEQTSQLFSQLDAGVNVLEMPRPTDTTTSAPVRSTSSP